MKRISLNDFINRCNHQQCLKHLRGNGCPKCSESNLEKIISKFLTKENIIFFQEYGKQNDLFFLKGQKVDFYLPDYKIVIECQGEQHFTPVDFGNKGVDFAIECFQKNIIRDYRKYSECKKIGLSVLYFCDKKNMRNDYISDLYCDLNEIKKRISNE
jgi:G:T-mismatch repair DNA endonuclease (very short patch repair protein)